MHADGNRRRWIWRAADDDDDHDHDATIRINLWEEGGSLAWERCKIEIDLLYLFSVCISDPTLIYFAIIIIGKEVAGK